VLDSWLAAAGARAAVVVAVAVALGGASSCKRSQLEDASAAKAWVDQTTADRAYAVLAGVDYLPTSYTRNGCYARALLIAMELADQGIPSSQVYLYGGVSPDPRSQPEWVFHVAPLLRVRETGKDLVMDPGFFAGPVERAEWQRRFATGTSPLRSVVLPGSFYVTEAMAGSLLEGKLVDRIVGSYEEMPPFRGQDVVDAVDALAKFTVLDRPQAPDTAKIARLGARARQLAVSLTAKGKLTALDAAALDRAIEVTQAELDEWQWLGAAENEIYREESERIKARAAEAARQAVKPDP
jgi:hypothetical protein